MIFSFSSAVFDEASSRGVEGFAMQLI